MTLVTKGGKVWRRGSRASVSLDTFSRALRIHRGLGLLGVNAVSSSWRKCRSRHPISHGSKGPSCRLLVAVSGHVCKVGSWKKARGCVGLHCACRSCDPAVALSARPPRRTPLDPRPAPASRQRPPSSASE